MRATHSPEFGSRLLCVDGGAERHRRRGLATRNVRLAAIYAFFRYCAAEHPDLMELCQRILAVPFKRAIPFDIEAKRKAI
jgi:hypothetical protein